MVVRVMSDLRDRIAETLAAHSGPYYGGMSDPRYRCRCGALNGRRLRGPSLEEHAAHQAEALLPLIRAERAQALRDAADDAEVFANEAYGEDLFRKPTRDDYDQINALLNRERGHKLDGISADCYRRALMLEAERLRARAEQEAAE